LVSHLGAVVNQIAIDFTLTRKQRVFSENRIEKGFDGIRLPYVKFPRDPEL
jgi:hypothetical protein